MSGLSLNLPQLSEGALSKMLNNSHVSKPILQILASKVMTDNKIRCVVTDGVTTHAQCLLFSNADVDKFTVVRVEKYMVNSLRKEDKAVLILQEMTIVMRGSQIGFKIGDNKEAVNVSPDVTKQFGQNSMADTVNNQRTHANQYNQNNSSRVNTNYNASRNAAINPDNVCPISAITPYYNAWLIRARVTSKPPIRTYSNAKGEGKLFSFDVLDESGGEVRITAFNKECERFFDLVQTDCIYYISRGSVKTANKKFNNLNCEYEITLNSDSIVEICNENVSMPSIKFKFTEIAKLDDMPSGTSVDVIGVIRAVSDISNIVSRKSNKDLKKRVVSIIDKSGVEVALTLWNNSAEEFNASKGHVIAVKNAVIGEFKGKNLSTIQSSTLHINPDTPEAHIIKGWYEREGQNMTNVRSLSRADDAGTSQAENRFLCAVTLQSVEEKPITFNATAMILNTGRSANQLYKACGNNGCNKKVRDENNGFYHCDKCDRDSTTFEYRLMLSAAIADCTGDVWLTLFQESAEKLLGMSARDLSILYENETEKYQSVIANITFKTFNFRINARNDEYNNERRVRSSAYSVNPVDYTERAKQLIQCIRSWNN